MIRLVPVLLFALALSAEELPLLVRDLPGIETVDSFSSGTEVWTTTGNTTWFTAWTAETTTDVFRTDGTTAGTVRVTFDADPETYLGLTGTKLIFTRDEDVYALDTNGGLPLLLTGADALANGVALDGVVYFVADVGPETELWRTDGTQSGTFKVDLLSGAQGAFDSALGHFNLYRMGDAIYFFGRTVYGTGLHRTRGTPESTTMVTPLDGFGSSDISGVHVSGDHLYFSGRGKVWATDGTSAGTVILADGNYFHAFAEFGGRLLFTINNQSPIWSTDGTVAGTRQTDIFTGFGTIYSGRVLGNKVFFFVSTIDGDELYVTEGTGATTRRIADVDHGNSYGDFHGFVLGGRYYFTNQTPAHGMELWVSDGNTAQLFVDINPGPASSSPSKITVRPDGRVLFSAEHVDIGIEPWITDGTVAGTRLLANLAPDTRTFSSSPGNLRATGNRVFFTARTTGGSGIGVSDGTTAGTTAMPFAATPSVAANGRYFVTWNGLLYAFDGTSMTWLGHDGATAHGVAGGVVFVGNDDDLWFSDGTLAGTRRILDLPSQSVTIQSLGNEAWVHDLSRTWITDGTQAGTRELVFPESRGSMGSVIRSGARYLLFAGSRLWRSDGTTAGTQVVKQTATGSFLGANAQVAYYVTTAGQLWRTDGTDAGTFALPVPASRCVDATFLGDTFIVRAAVVQRVELWRSDGSTAGTTRLATFSTFDPCLIGVSKMAERGDVLHFVGYDAVHGLEPWVTDGTVAGTRMLVDLYPGRTGSEPDNYTRVGDALFFSARTPTIGTELWAIGARAAVPKRRAAGPR